MLFFLFGYRCMRHKLCAEFPFLQIVAQNLLHDSFWYSHPFYYESARRPTIFLQNISYASNVFGCSCHCRSSTSLLIRNRLSPFWKCVVPTKHCSTMYSRFPINFLNHFKCFCGIKMGFLAKTNRCTLFNFFSITIYNTNKTDKLRHIANMYPLWMVPAETSHARRKDLLTNFPKFHGDRATSTMFSQRCCKTDQTLYIPKNFLSPKFFEMLQYSSSKRWSRAFKIRNFSVQPCLANSNFQNFTPQDFRHIYCIR